jgi:hypothetical protein
MKQKLNELLQPLKAGSSSVRPGLGNIGREGSGGREASERLEQSFATPSQFERPMSARPNPSRLNSNNVQLPFFNTVPYIRRLHYKALRALSVSTPPPPQEAEVSPSSKEFAQAMLHSMGHTWNSIFEADFPPPSEGGVIYEFTMIG